MDAPNPQNPPAVGAGKIALQDHIPLPPGGPVERCGGGLGVRIGEEDCVGSFAKIRMQSVYVELKITKFLPS